MGGRGSLDNNRRIAMIDTPAALPLRYIHATPRLVSSSMDSSQAANVVQHAQMPGRKRERKREGNRCNTAVEGDTRTETGLRLNSAQGVERGL